MLMAFCQLSNIFLEHQDWSDTEVSPVQAPTASKNILIAQYLNFTLIYFNTSLVLSNISLYF